MGHRLEFVGDDGLEGAEAEAVAVGEVCFGELVILKVR